MTVSNLSMSYFYRHLLLFSLFSVIQTLNYLNCTSQGQCLNCLTPYQCQTCTSSSYSQCCPLFCTKCINMNTCFQCEPNFILQPTSTNWLLCVRGQNWTDPYQQSLIPDRCINGYYFQTNIKTCLSCNFINCQSCNASQTCSVCLQGYFLQIYSNYSANISNCLSCPQNCQICTNLYQCTICQQRFYLYQDSLCQACHIPNCFKCINQTICTMCNLGPGQATSYYLSEDSTQCLQCSLSIINCNNCTINSNKTITCYTCFNGYFLLNNNCQNKCLPNCAVCTNSTICQVCSQSYGMDQNNSIKCSYCCFGFLTCNLDSNGLIISSECSQYFTGISLNNFSCVPCYFPCIYCDYSPNNCTRCSEIYFFTVQITGSYSRQCFFCNISDCIKCTSEQNCTICQIGYFIANILTNGQILGQCIQCSSNCLECLSFTTCKLCEAGYYFKQFGCVKCPGENVQFCNLSAEQPIYQIYCREGYIQQIQVQLHRFQYVHLA